MQIYAWIPRAHHKHLSLCNIRYPKRAFRELVELRAGVADLGLISLSSTYPTKQPMTRRLGTSGQDLKFSKCKLGLSSNGHILETNIEDISQHLYGRHTFGGFKCMIVVHGVNFRLCVGFGYVYPQTICYLASLMSMYYFNVFLRYMIPHTNDLNVSKRVCRRRDVTTAQAECRANHKQLELELKLASLLGQKCKRMWTFLCT